MGKDEFNKTYADLPDDVKNAMASMKTANSIYNTARSQKLSLENIPRLAEITGDVMLGKLPIDFFTNTIQAELYMDHAKARRVAESITNEVFSPIAVGLSQVQANIK